MMLESQSPQFSIDSYFPFQMTSQKEEKIYNSAVPMVVESSGMGEKVFDIYSRLLRERIIFLGTAIDDKLADSIVAQLLYL